MGRKLCTDCRLLFAVSLLAAALSCREAQTSANSDHFAAHAEGASPAASTLAAKTAAEDITSSGPIVVENQLDVAAQREGMVAEILADTGKMVRRGDLLAKLDDRELAADRDAAEAKLHSIEANVKNWEAEIKVLEADRDRSEKMWAAQIITKEQLDHDRFKVEADRYELERERQTAINQQDVIRSLNLEVEKTRIVAPFDGVVARRYVRAGQRVASGDRLFWVTAIAPLRVTFTLP
ncbi:MAG: efflux RND transporter periplasmic adaptor subunit, partial [Terriglobales bacterium]